VRDIPGTRSTRILQRLEFHYTPKHASWLNMVEIEIGVLREQCLGRRIGDRTVLNTEGAAEIGPLLSRHRQRVEITVTRY
jgi:hypothetical protein